MSTRLSRLCYGAIAVLALVLAGCSAPKPAEGGAASTTSNSGAPVSSSSPLGQLSELTKPSNGITLSDVVAVSDRTYAAKVSTSAISDKSTNSGNGVRITLPVNFNPQQRYSVLYLLHGSGGADTSASWFVQGNVEQITAAWPVIVVMPDAGKAGWYNDWTNSPIAQKWQTYYLDQLIPWIDKHLPTIADRAHRVIGGFSAGGYGAIHLAEARPDLFAQVISLSGLLDFHPTFARSLLEFESSLVVGLPDAIFGNGTSTSEAQWAKPDPIESINKLADTYLQILVGSGAQAADTESQLRGTNESFVEVLGKTTTPFDYTMYGKPGNGCDGGHDWGCWSAALNIALKAVAAHMGLSATSSPMPSNPAMTTVTKSN